MQQPAISTLKWMRVFGDTIFAAGTVALGYFIFGLKLGWSTVKKNQ
jgi:nitric oxide reductase subunit B